VSKVSDHKTIMIVDDSKVSRMMISAIIKDKYPDLVIVEAVNGQEAIKLSESKTIDFFSVDYNMPEMDGLEMIAELNSKLPNSKFALLTANIQDATHQKAAALGAKCFNKPINEECIVKVLEYFCG
jgi:two-component system, chemotaxis family, chemotaxis protein CheY